MAIDKQFLFTELAKLNGARKQSGNWLMVCCPFHGERNPSCGINLDTGSWNCLACDESGNWNKFAEKAGLKTLKRWEKNATDEVRISQELLEEELLGTLTLKDLTKRMYCEEATRWPKDIKWRGFEGDFLYKLGAHIIKDKYEDSIAVLFPIKVAGQLRGGIKAVYERKNKKQLAYINMKGEWIKTYGLFPYIFVRSMLKKNLDFVVLVEGPRDALRLCYNGIPALAVLGAKNMTLSKLNFVLGLGIKTIYVMPDNDEAGELLWKATKKHLKEYKIKPIKIKLPTQENGNKKIDPANVKASTLKKIAFTLADIHGFKPRKTYV